MVKVKVEKKMNLLELLKWAQENDITNRTFFGHGITFVFIDRFGLIKCVGVNPEQIFTVEVEEEITEETKIHKFLVIFLDMSISNCIEIPSIGEDESIKEILQGNEKRSLTIKSIHLVNDDKTHTLIWKDGELVGNE
ncbi:hypothetical protein K4Q82_03810 [Staphylococcus epidermidis]|nr:hypothetical protein [Staphylococcus epidermidis]